MEFSSQLTAANDPSASRLQLLAAAVPPQNPTMIACDQQWEYVRSNCQLFRDVVETIAGAVGMFLPQAACDQLIQAVVRERIAEAINQTLEKFDHVLSVRFKERRVLDNEVYYREITDVLTGECEEFGWTYGGGKAASLWKVERLLALAGKGVTA
jgi:hypothetical protein